MAAESIAQQLQYLVLERRKEEWVLKQQIPVHVDWLPFYFAYADIFYGLQFTPIDLKWRRLATVQDLFDLYFQLSLGLWLVNNNQTDDPRGLMLELFGIPRTFDTTTLPLKYGHRCSDPLARIVSFKPLQLPLAYYSEEDCESLLEWYGFEKPDYAVSKVLRVFDASEYTVFASVLSPNYLALQPPLILPGEGELQYWLRYAVQIINTPFPSFNVKERTSLLTPSEYTVWEQEWRIWIMVQLNRLILCNKSVSHYMGAGFGEVNPYCRYGSDRKYSDMARHLNNLFTLTPPLPAQVVVSRVLTDTKFTKLPLNVVQVEEGFMSVSLVGLSPTFFSSRTQLTLKVPAGASILALLARSNFQQELLLPPGTRYRLTRRWEEGGLVQYEGDVLL